MPRYIAVPAALLSLALLAQMPANAPDPWKESDLIQPQALAARLTGSAPKPKILYVGFPILYRGAHISGAELAGPASKPEGLELLKQTAAKLSRTEELIIYCGCCPWDHCPNVRPAFRLLHEMGFTRLKLVTIPTNMSTDWVTKGYPVERAAAKSE
jgi:thiosulfate/3-mercaptopyruvate sulfurtransferase